MAYRNSGVGGAVARPMDGGDPRTPMAWQHRDMNTSQHDQRYTTESHRDRQREPTSPSRNGGYPSPSRHSDRHPDMGRSTPGSKRGRGQSSDRSEKGNRSSRERDDRGYSRSQSRERVPKGYSRSQPSPSTTDGTTEDTTETDSQTVEREGSEYQGQMVPGYPMMMGYPMMQPQMTVPMMMPGTGSIRSVQSVPMLNPHSHTWDGEPCPVHHHHPMVPLAALYGMGGGGVGYAPSMSLAYSVPPSVISGATTVRRARSVAELSQPGAPPGIPYAHADTLEHEHRRSMHASMASLGHSQMRRPVGHRMVMAENGAPSNLPIRQEQKKVSPIPSKDGKEKGLGCCSGHFVVIWIILGIVTFGVLLGIVLKFMVS